MSSLWRAAGGVVLGFSVGAVSLLWHPVTLGPVCGSVCVLPAPACVTNHGDLSGVVEQVNRTGLRAQPGLCCAVSAMRAMGAACACAWGHASVPLHPWPSYYVCLCVRGKCETAREPMPHCCCILRPGRAWMRAACGRPVSRNANLPGILYTGIGNIMYVWLIFFCSLWLNSRASPAQARMASRHSARLQGCVVYSLLLLHTRLASGTRSTLHKGAPSVCIRVVNAWQCASAACGVPAPSKPPMALCTPVRRLYLRMQEGSPRKK